MEICHLSVEVLKPNPENLFNPLTSQEYLDLRKSIATYGVQVPLIVTPEEGGYFTVISGNNRLRAAKELGIKTLPCQILDIEMFEGAMDTEIFRRHLSPEERSQYKVLKEEKSREILEREIEKKLHSELYELYKKGLISLDFAIKVMKFDMETQTTLLKSLSPPPVVVEKVVEKEVLVEKNSPEDDEKDEVISRLKSEIGILQLRYNQKEHELAELRKWKLENQDRIEEKLEELKKEKARASETVRKEFKKEVEGLFETNEKLTKQIRTKEIEIEALKEEIEKIKKNYTNHQIEAKAAKVLVLEEERKYLKNIVIYRLDEVLKTLQEVRESINENNLSKRMEGLVVEKIKNIYEELIALSERIGQNSLSGEIFSNGKEQYQYKH